MRQKRKYRVLTFRTTSQAMAMEKFCTQNHVGGRLIPVPVEISAGCGLAWRMEPLEYLDFLKKYPDKEQEFQQAIEILL
ncbi:MAG: DUF3343 domain-containing protein [Eubacteriales bacterium]|nr:DUF3343 domain-containing protein [Eubacteriales bacterium]